MITNCFLYNTILLSIYKKKNNIIHVHVYVVIIILYLPFNFYIYL